MLSDEMFQFLMVQLHPAFYTTLDGKTLGLIWPLYLACFPIKRLAGTMSFFSHSALTGKTLSMVWEARGKRLIYNISRTRVAIIPAGI